MVNKTVSINHSILTLKISKTSQRELPYKKKKSIKKEMNSSEVSYEAKYYLVLPKKSMNEAMNTESRLNDENPMYRIRNTKKSKETQEEGNVLKSIYPTSYLPDFFFTNTISQPFLIFYNLNKKFEETKNGQTFRENNEQEKSIIDQLNELFDVNILSITQLKTDINQVADTWYKRFPYSKSNTFHPIHDDFKATEISDLQSLHLLGFSLNIGIYLLFYIDNDKILYNMKLGPDNSENDVHFKIFANVNKELLFDDEKVGKVYRQEKWLSFQRINVGKIFNYKSKVIPFDPENNLLYLEMERRDPIPIIKLPDFSEKSFKEITLQKKIVNKTIPNISFEIKDDKNNKNKDKKGKKNTEAITNLGIEITISNSDQGRVLNKFNSLVTKLDDSKFKGHKVKIENEDISLIAETNDSAFLVKKTKLDQQQKLKDCTFKIGKEIKKEQIEKSIISFHDRVKLPYTYSYLIDEETGKSKHPLINLLCVHHLTDVMILSTEAIDRRINRINKSNRLRLVPVENDDDVYYSFRICDNDKTNWKKITDSYPSILSIGSNKSYDYNYTYKREYNDDEPKQFQDFYFFVNKMPSELIKEFRKLRLRSKNLIDYYMKSDVGLNPIFCPAILKEYNELSKASCIAFYSDEQYDDPLNSTLLRDVQSVKEVVSRTTIDLFDEDEVNENVRRGNFPVKIQSLLTRIKMKGNQKIPDPSFAFTKQFSIKTEEDICQLKDLRKPEYEYKFYSVYNGKIVNTSKFVISSQYEISYLYVSQNNVFSIAQVDDNKFAYGHCNTIDTEMIFDSFHIGSFKTAIYMENKKCLIIAYQKKKDKSILFTGYDEQGQIIDTNFNIFDKNDKEIVDFKFDSLATISRSYFAAQFTVERNEKIKANKNKSKKAGKENEQDIYDYSVFKYDPQKRTIVKCNYNELWRVKENSLCKAFLKEKVTNPMCFIGSRLDSSYKNSSTLCIYKYENDNLDPISSNEGSSSNEDTSFDFDFILDEDENDEIIDYDNRLLENRIKERNSQNKANDNKIIIPSMMNCVKIESKKKFTVFDFDCSLCELFPSPLVINNRLVCYSNGSLSFYLCDYRIYRLISHQISCFFINTLQRMSLFTTEMLLCRYNFDKIQIAIIVDTCGIGARLSNLLFGTRFDENQIIDNEIWSGFSYSNDSAFIILLFHVKDTENIYNAIQARKQIKNPFIFICSNDGAKNSIKFGIDPKIICNTSSSGTKDVILFVNNNELEEKIVDLYDSIHNAKYNKKYYNNSNIALVFAKEIITQYLSFEVFVNYPHKTIEKYSHNIFDEVENAEITSNKIVELDYFLLKQT